MASSLITQRKSNNIIKFLQFVDIFAFIPVPKDESVSTKQSLIGTVLFLAIFLTYVIYDFVSFVTINQPIQQTYRSPIDDKTYSLPDFAVAFMKNEAASVSNFNYTEAFDGLFTYEWTSLTKSRGK